MRFFALPIATAAISLLANGTPTQAGVPLAWVAGGGSDSGTCTISAPCGSFTYALSQVDNNGIITVLSSGDFGPVNITKSVAIYADGVDAVIKNTTPCGVLPSAVVITPRASICVNVPSGVVILRGFTIDMNGNPNDYGVNLIAATSLQMQNCGIRKGLKGFFAAPGASTKIFMSDCTVADNNSDGILVAPTGSANVHAVFERVHIENNGHGMTINGDGSSGVVRATIRDGVIAGNRGNGMFIAKGAAPGANRTMIDRTVISNNSHGLHVTGTNVRAYLGDSAVSGNTFGLQSGAGATLASFGTNKVAGNDTNGSPSGSVAPE